jgi:medium-chain acyl-[acyl-carrier-protein] hydrolase
MFLETHRCVKRIAAPVRPFVGFWPYVSAPRTDGVRLICFAHAGGGGAAYRSWPTALPVSVGLHAVTLPGREDRVFERPLTDLRHVVGEICRAIEPLLDRPFAIFGHSLGALIGAEVALTLHRTTGRQPIHLFVSGCPALHEVADPRQRHLWSDGDLLALLRDLNGTPAELLRSPEFARLLLRAFRADLALLAQYRYRPGRRMDMPVTAFGGSDDPTVTPAELQAWAEITTGPHDVVVFPGDHFYLRHRQAALLRTIIARLEKA